MITKRPYDNLFGFVARKKRLLTVDSLHASRFKITSRRFISPHEKQ